MKITDYELKELGFTQLKHYLYLDAKIGGSFGLIYKGDLLSLECDYCTEIELPHIDTINKVKELYCILKGKDIECPS